MANRGHVEEDISMLRRYAQRFQGWQRLLVIFDCSLVFAACGIERAKIHQLPGRRSSQNLLGTEELVRL